jgi:parallel beta-helix repeat protein
MLGSIVWSENQPLQPPPNDPFPKKPAFSLTAPQITSSIQLFTPHTPILIYGEEDFISQATTMNWPGEGTINTPIIIEGYTISAAEEPLISIHDTRYYFIIRNNLLNGSNAATKGIHFSNVQHGIIENNTICNNTDGGIDFEFFSSHNLIINNSIFGNQIGMNIKGQNNRIINNSVSNNKEMAIWLNTDTFNSTVVGNTIYNNTGSGIQLEESQSNFISRNTILGSEMNGIDLLFTSQNVIDNNAIFNTVLGISLYNASQNNVTSNYMFNNMGGISLYYSSNNSFWNNTAQENFNSGVDLELSSHNNTFYMNKLLKNGIVGIVLFDSDFNTFTENIISNNNMEGIRIEGNTHYNIFTFNNFTDNYTPAHQAKDGGENNIFIFNYWNDWITPDSDSNGIIDLPYPIKGASANYDSHPVTSLQLDHEHIVSTPIIFFPETGDTLKDISILRWTSAIDSLKHSVSYSVYYNSGQGEDWIQLAANLSQLFYTWDTETVLDGVDCKIKVEVRCDQELIVTAISVGTFSISNTGENINPFMIQMIIVLLCLLVVGSVSYLVYTSRLKPPSVILELFQSDQMDFLKSLYGKVIIGLENVQSGVIPEPRGLPFLEPIKPPDPTTLIDSFPPNIRKDLKSGLKGRTVLAFIEIAYQLPEETNPMKLAKILDIPPATISYEINRLIKLHYLEPYLSPQVLKDARFRNYTITPKGVSFLRFLKDALDLSIQRVREKDQSFDVN